MLKTKLTAKRLALYFLMGTGLAAVGCLEGCHRQAATFPVTTQVVVLGFDGVDPNLASKWMAEGRLPNLTQLQREGAFKPLGTTNPPESPVAWAYLARGPRDHQRARRRPGADQGRPLVHQGKDGRARPRCSAVSTPGTSTSGISGSRTPACSPRCTCSPRSASRNGRCPALLAEYSRYYASGELNSLVADQAATTALVKQAFAGRVGVRTDELDGLTVSARPWWFNLRPSNTEPLLRLNVEADTSETMTAVRDEVLGLVRGTA